MSAHFRNRADAGRRLAVALERVDLGDAVVVGLARGGVVVAADVARRLDLPLDAVAVRKIGHPYQPEYALGAVAPGAGGVYLRADEALGDAAFRRAIGQAQAQADALDGIIHEHHRPLDLHGRTAVLVDDGLATGATMIAAVRWARARGAARVVVAVPVGAVQSTEAIRRAADEVVCPHEEPRFGAVGFWYRDFTQVETAGVIALLDELESVRDDDLRVVHEPGARRRP
jgi:putative phosphoribosyl transferase